MNINIQYEFIFVLITVFLSYIISMVIKKSRNNFPPGPMGLPILGYLPFLSKNMHLDLMKLGKKYGDVFSINLGSQSVVVLHGVDAIKEALNKQAFLGRPPNGALEKFSPTSAFFSSHFNLWKEQRRFVMQSMKELGLGKTKLEVNIMDEISHFIDILRSHKAQPMNLKDPLSPSVSNNICALIFGKRFEYDDPDRQFLDKSVDELFEKFPLLSFDEFFPWLHYIPFATKILQGPKTSAIFKNYRNFFEKEANKHLETFDSDHIRDFMDRYLLEIETQKGKNPNTSFNFDMLMSNAIDLFVAGSETTRTSILWFIYIMAAYPEVQKKVKKEIMEVIGSERKPEFMDMRNMPYTHAVIMEIMRWKTVVSLNVVHCTIADTTVGGYNVPKGTTVIANLWAAHHDPRYWDEPDEFKPERFLSKDGKTVMKPSSYMPFALGKRSCPGESLAYMEMFLYFTSILREFDVAFPDGTQPTFNANFLVTYKADPYLVRFIPKNLYLL